MMATALNVARFLIFLKHHDSRNLEITNLKLQKLLYYCQGHYLAMYNQTLFDDNIEAWKLGPVIPEVYYTYNDYGSLEIPEENRPFNIEELDLNDQELGVIAYVWKKYGELNAWQLVDKTHSESPWINSWKNSFDKTIRRNELEVHFNKNLANRLYISVEA
jgi:uncharacterized phage-associated protein